MIKPNPPPQLPKEKEPRDVFQRWLYQLWEYVVNGSVDDMNNLLADRVFDRAIPTWNPTIDASNVLSARAFQGAHPESAWTFQRVAGNLTVDGNTILGDTSADTLTINAGTWTYGNNFTATRAVGVAPGGTTNAQEIDITFTSSPLGTTELRGQNHVTTASGADPIVFFTPLRMVAVYAGSSTANQVTGFNFRADNASTGIVTELVGTIGRIAITGAGNVSLGEDYLARAPVLSSTGACTTLAGFRSEDMGHATLVTNALGFDCLDQTASVTLTVGFRSQVTSGTGKWGFYSSGSANNAFSGKVRIGSVVAPTVALDVTGAGAISGDLTLPAAPSDPIMLAQIFGG